MIIAPSILAADFLNLEKDILKINNSDCEWIHLDIMDGNFVPNISFGYSLVKEISKMTNLFLDCHLMIENAEKYVENFCNAGANSITVHVENTNLEHFLNIKKICHSNNVALGIALNPSTQICTLSQYIEYCDMVLIMSVNPGFGGQKFIESTYMKIKKFRQINPDIKIQIDGGVTDENAKKLAKLGAYCLVAGSYLFKGDFNSNVKTLRS